MNKTDLISYVATETELNKESATNAVEAIFGAITSTLAGGEAVNIVGFGAFSVTARAARTARNPRTGEPIEVAASNAPKFKAGKALKDAVK